MINKAARIHVNLYFLIKIPPFVFQLVSTNHLQQNSALLSYIVEFALYAFAMRILLHYYIFKLALTNSH